MRPLYHGKGFPPQTVLILLTSCTSSELSVLPSNPFLANGAAAAPMADKPGASVTTEDTVTISEDENELDAAADDLKANDDLGGQMQAQEIDPIRRLNGM